MLESVRRNRLALRVGVMGAASLSLAFGAAVAVPTMALAATPRCNSVKYVEGDIGEVAAVPSYKSGSTNTTTCTLSQGASGTGVSTLQLAILQCTSVSITVDGSFGPATASALKSVQRSKGISADGIYGTQTRKAMSFPSSTDDSRDSCYRVP
jgi:murein L,D-transpeptidase YcbB/YkuD